MHKLYDYVVIIMILCVILVHISAAVCPNTCHPVVSLFIFDRYLMGCSRIKSVYRAATENHHYIQENSNWCVP